MTILPRRLVKGDTIGIVSPASPFPVWFPRRFARSVSNLESKGYKVKLGAHVRDKLGHKAGSKEDRLADLHEMYRDKSVKLLMTTLGGYNSNELLDDLDCDLVRQNPKGLIGYSDITTLHLAIHARTGLVSFYGPHLMSQFGEYPDVLPYTLECFEKVVCQTRPAGRIEPSKVWTEERLEYDQEDNRPRSMKTTAGWKSLKPGHASGPLIGGEISTLVIQNDTQYMPSVDGAVFFWEDYGSSPAWVDRYLANLRTKDVFERIKGMLVGRTRTAGFEPTSTGYGLDNIILDNTKGYDFPIMINMDFGHTDPMMTLPIGIRATMRAEEGYLSIDEPAVA
jgi:muramoyltetrapeptide carboxypeptidase